MLLASTREDNVLIVCTLLAATFAYLAFQRKHWSVQLTGLILGMLAGASIYLALASWLWPDTSKCFYLLKSTEDWCLWRVAMFILSFLLLLCTTVDSETPVVRFRSSTGVKELDRW